MENIVPKPELTILNNLTIVISLSLSLIFLSCQRDKRHEYPKNGVVEGVGYIVSTELMNNRFFDNGIFYFIPVNHIDSLHPIRDFNERNFQLSYAFVLYSSYYIRLINSMSWDFKVYELDVKKDDPKRLNIEFRRILPVKITFTFDTAYLKNNIQQDSILDYKRRLYFHYKMVDEIKIRKLEILMPKGDDLSGHEAMYGKTRYYLCGNIINK
ncbi:MAG: hypothetical protein Q8861_13710 [Bacteroidota bacterium]|nr:hypothetical protein [Bacteroidota bacterium]